METHQPAAGKEGSNGSQPVDWHLSQRCSSVKIDHASAQVVASFGRSRSLFQVASPRPSSTASGPYASQRSMASAASSLHLVRE